MALEIVSGESGLWRDPQWAEGMPGVYALVAGASYYPHLDGGENPAPETYGLGQLISSATTAADFFQWLRDAFTLKGRPVVWCYLLLSPTPEERVKFESRGLLHYSTPDNTTLRRAIKSWTGHVPKKPPGSENSRTLFFFSGHGVQATHKSIILPSDYLNPQYGEPQLEDCIGIFEMWQWMGESPVAEHLALVDACRNEFSPLAAKAASAHSVFPGNPPGGKSKRVAACLSGTSENSLAYQSPRGQYTFFGQAVLECVKRRSDQSDSLVELDELWDWVKKRVPLLLREAHYTNVDQIPRLQLDGDRDLVITEIPELEANVSVEVDIPMDVFITENPELKADLSYGLGATRSTRSISSNRSSGLPPAFDIESVEEAMDDRFNDALSVAEAISLESLSRDWNEAHRRFGHEFATLPWFGDRVDLRSLVGASSCRESATVRVVERDEQSSVVQVDLTMSGLSPGGLLIFQDGSFVERGRLGICLPSDLIDEVPIRLTLTIAPASESEPCKIQKVVAQLGPSEWNEHYAYLWDLVRKAELGSLRKAAELADPARLKRAARGKRRSPIAATAGMLLLARAGDLGKVGNWTHNLMKWFPGIPDGGVLWAASIRDALLRGDNQPFGVADPFDEMAAALETLASRGLPFFSDALELADTLVRYTLRQQISAERRGHLQDVALLIDRALCTTLSGGHFLVVPGIPRPEWLGNEPDPLAVEEMLLVLGRRSAP